MKFISVSYSDALRELSNDGSNNRSGIRSVIDGLKSRLPGGHFYSKLVGSSYIHRAVRNEGSASLKKYWLVRYFLGSSFSDRFRPDLKKRAKQFEAGLRDLGVPCRKMKYMYHFAPVEALCGISEKGIVPPENGGKVFLAASSRGFYRYLCWKSKQLQRDLTFVELKVDAHRLAKEHCPVYYLLNEAVCDRVPFDCIVTKLSHDPLGGPGPAAEQ